MKANKKLTKAQQRKCAIEACLVDMIYELEDKGFDEITATGSLTEIIDSYSDLEDTEYVVCKEDFSPSAATRLFKSTRVQATLKNLIGSLCYNLRINLKSKHCVNAR